MSNGQDLITNALLGQGYNPTANQLPGSILPGAATGGVSQLLGIGSAGQGGAGAAGGFLSGINPLIGSGLLGLGGSVLKGIFGGMGKKQEDKRKWDMFMKRMDLIKPKGEYYGGNIKQLDPVVQQVVMGMLGQRGATGGADISQFLSGLAGQGQGGG